MAKKTSYENAFKAKVALGLMEWLIKLRYLVSNKVDLIHSEAFSNVLAYTVTAPQKLHIQQGFEAMNNAIGERINYLKLRSEL